jgi:two-component system cell cycle sensor histidine kinase/response regulator CckA
MDIERKMQEAQRLEGIGLLAGGVAIDFNNLLTAIMGMASLARIHCSSNGPATRSLVGIEAACKTAAGLCAQLLAYAGRGRVRVAPVSLHELVHGTAELVRASTPKNVELQLSFPDSSLPVLGDRSQLQHVAMNLLINAVEAIPASRGRSRCARGASSVARSISAQP